jgi:hypothetical protein
MINVEEWFMIRELGLDHSVGHLRTCAVDFEARVADPQKPKSP